MDEMCSVLVISCDEYSDTWKPFFTLFNEYWKECPYNIYLSTQELDFNYENLKINIINHNKNFLWSDRLIDSLNKIKTKYVITLLDDFFIKDHVDQDKINNCLSWLEQDENIATFSFENSLWQDIDDKLYDGFELRPHYGYYKFNTQAAIWRKSDLLKILRNNETPWESENFGTLRTYFFVKQKKFYVAKKDVKKIVNYDFCGAIHKSKWIKNMPSFLQSHNITGIDYNIRGLIDNKEMNINLNKSSASLLIIVNGLLHYMIKKTLKSIGLYSWFYNKFIKR